MKFNYFILIAAFALSNCSVNEPPVTEDVSYDTYEVSDNLSASDCGMKSKNGMLSNAVQITTGDTHTCALLDNGNVSCWGSNPWGKVKINKPVCVNDLSNVSKIDANGGYETCALINDGTIKCLNTSDGIVRTVDGIENAVNIESGDYDGHCAILSNGNTMCWGNKFNVEQTPILISDFKYFKSIKTSSGTTCGLSYDGTVSCLFYNKGYDSDSVFKKIDSLKNITTIDLKLGSELCAIDNKKEVYCGEVFPILDTIHKIDNADLVVGVSSGNHMNCILTEFGLVKCWDSGKTNYVSLTGVSHYNNFVDGLNDVVQISTSGYNNVFDEYAHVCSLINDGTIRCWGDNGYGQLGDGTFLDSNEPSPVMLD